MTAAMWGGFERWPWSSGSWDSGMGKDSMIWRAVIINTAASSHDGIGQ